MVYSVFSLTLTAAKPSASVSSVAISSPSAVTSTLTPGIPCLLGVSSSKTKTPIPALLQWSPGISALRGISTGMSSPQALTSSTFTSLVLLSNPSAVAVII